MEHVVVRWEPANGGYWVDPRPYLEALTTIGPTLPPGARAYAEDPDHYNFASGRCVKDLWFGSLRLDDGARVARLTLLPHSSKHELSLVLEYLGVESTTGVRDRDPGAGWFGSVLLDELIPIAAGVLHELALTGGTIRIVARDVVAHWEAMPT